ncbi:hypothetical protein L6164_025053 [Bauhinia variegata]|uniref:Uncharacterized protein n=1 Tax=Bauhinia variegata TaxID=167791 RepID=A0ACB9LZJ5_BAUVA|nr:hypothetical protein L6164_025053 [Bauhinia variegata]
MDSSADFLTWSLCLVLFLALWQPQGAQGTQTVPGLGINWGSQVSHPLNPYIMVNLLKDNGFTKVKLFEADSWTVSAFSGTNIEVMVGIPNVLLAHLADNSKHAENWVKNNLTKHLDGGGVNIRYVAVGNEAFLESYNGSYIKTTFPAMVNVQKALEKAGLGDKVKVVTPLNADVYRSPSNLPSHGDFRDDIYDEMKKILQFLSEKNSPFVVNIYPFLNLHQSIDFPEGFAFFNTGTKTIQDNNLQYTNVFDANFDTLVWALKKAGHSDLKIMVGEVGWPTDGAQYANPSDAEKFYKGLLKQMANKKGTPLRPGVIDIYLFSVSDEDLKSIAPGNFERHWGIFRYDGKPKFAIDFSGQGVDKMPLGAKGVQYQDRQWCVVNPDLKNQSTLGRALDYACGGADCTSLGFFSSCADLSVVGNASFAFNQYFQVRDQSVEACDFWGLGTIVKEDPSNGTCFFPIEIVSSGRRLHKLTGFLIGCLLMFVTFM